ncbi:MAG TPA: leucyl aminopeptidase family protein [Acidimicrobiales bacterium]|nr:leucyl aminopeptidase family protein [Acidimicrobiales bacterium]
MSRSPHVVALKDALAGGIVAVPVVFDAGAAYVSKAIPTQIGEVRFTHELSKEWCAQNGLKPDAGSVVVLRAQRGPGVALVSLGVGYNRAESYRLAGASASRVAGDNVLSFLLPTDAIEAPGIAAQSFVEGVLLASYTFKSSKTLDLNVVPIAAPLPTVAVHDEVTSGVTRGEEIAQAVNWAKRLIDTPASDLTPKDLARRFEERLEGEAFVDVEVWTESRIKEERLGGLLGVGRGSAQPARLVRATYDPSPGSPMPHVALVGKGITFDSGGLSLKAAEGMMTMKTDMSGAAIVMATLLMVSRLRLALRVTAIAPLAENLVGEHATKPGDVLKIRNGMTIEVLNTDAEGRLVLADGLCLATEINPDAIIDVATLTGAQKVALGDQVGALFASTDDLAERFAQASARSGEQLWRMPLVDSYESHVESDVADLKNIGKASVAGTIIGALILRRFTQDRPWVHLDIAGPGRAEAASGYVTKGATAFSARTLVEFLRDAATRT